MEIDDKCVVIKKSEYVELVKKANTPKTEIITIQLEKHVPFGYIYPNIVHAETIDLSQGIRKQIRKILESWGDKVKLEDRTARKEFKKKCLLEITKVKGYIWWNRNYKHLVDRLEYMLRND